jgi:hypothetical protein
MRPAGELADGHGRTHRLFTFDPGALGAQRRRRRLLGGLGLVGILGLGVAARLVRQHLEEARRPAVLVLDIRPSGDVFVDGELKGTAPPLTRLALAPGPHSIEIRSGRARPLKTDVNLQPGEELQLTHTFVVAPPVATRRKARPAPPTLLDRLKFW